MRVRKRAKGTQRACLTRFVCTLSQVDDPLSSPTVTHTQAQEDAAGQAKLVEHEDAAAPAHKEMPQPKGQQPASVDPEPAVPRQAPLSPAVGVGSGPGSSSTGLQSAGANPMEGV